MPATISGEITIPAAVGSFTHARAYVRLEDVSRLDAPARLITQQIIEHVTHQSGRTSHLAFELRAAQLDPSAQCNVRVHIDLDGDGQVSQGDLISTQSYPPPVRRPSERISVQVHPIGQ